MAAARKRSKRLPTHKVSRTHVVWGSLLAAMTLVGGGLLLLDKRPGVSAAVPMMGLATPKASSNLAAIFNTNSSIQPGRWTGIVIHHSGSPVGSAETITQQHNARGFKGLGHHFVISNGQGAPDGQIFVGYRWQDQLPGVHVAGPKAEQFNRQTIGICLVGDGERRTFTDAQIARLSELVTTLQQQLNIPDSQVVLHREVGPTSSPGRMFPTMSFRQALADVR